MAPSTEVQHLPILFQSSPLFHLPMKVVRKMAANLSRICHFPTKMHQRRCDSARDEAISALKDVGSLALIKY